MTEKASDPPPGGRPDATFTATRSSAAVPTVSSDWLFRDAVVVRIEHGGEVYMLRKTRSGKLILTK
jgi:hemin uptake protein HemP